MTILFKGFIHLFQAQSFARKLKARNVKGVKVTRDMRGFPYGVVFETRRRKR